MNAKKKKTGGATLIALLFFIFGGCDPGLAGSYLDLEPGVSKKTDADRRLGAPIGEISKGAQYDYGVQPDTRRISIKFNKNNQVIESIDIFPEEAYSKSQFRDWFQLGDPEKTGRNEKGNLVEYYVSAGIALHFSGAAERSPVEYFSHFDPPKPEARAATAEVNKKSESAYIQESKKAVAAKDWPRAKQLIEEALPSYPDSAELWHSRALYYFYTDAEPPEIGPKEALRSMEKAYALEPGGENAADLGWLFWELQRDCPKALRYFEEADRKGHAQKSPALHFWMGKCYENIGEYEKAKASYRRFVAANPSHELAREAENRLRSKDSTRPRLNSVLDLSSATEAWAREWTVTASAVQISGGGKFGFFPSAERRGDANPNAGRKGILYVHPPQQGVPAKIERNATLGATPVLRLGVSANRSPNGDWDLTIRVNGESAGGRRTIDGRQGWQDLTYDLSPYANRFVTITIEVIPTDWQYEYAFFDYIELR